MKQNYLLKYCYTQKKHFHLNFSLQIVKRKKRLILYIVSICFHTNGLTLSKTFNLIMDRKWNLCVKKQKNLKIQCAFLLFAWLPVKCLNCLRHLCQFCKRESAWVGVFNMHLLHVYVWLFIQSGKNYHVWPLTKKCSVYKFNGRFIWIVRDWTKTKKIKKKII